MEKHIVLEAFGETHLAGCLKDCGTPEIHLKYLKFITQKGLLPHVLDTRVKNDAAPYGCLDENRVPENPSKSRGFTPSVPYHSN